MFLNLKAKKVLANNRSVYRRRRLLLNQIRCKVHGEAFYLDSPPFEENQRKNKKEKKREEKESRILETRRETAKAFAGQEGLLITVRDG